RRGEMAALFGEVAFQLDAPADAPVLRVGLAEFVPHAVVVGVLVVEDARALEGLHGGDVALADVFEGGVGIGRGGSAGAEAVAGVELGGGAALPAHALRGAIEIDGLALGVGESLCGLGSVIAGNFLGRLLASFLVGALRPVDVVADHHGSAGGPAALGRQDF